MTESVDAVVVGSGPCGALAAHDLAASGFSVTILEAGKRFDPATHLRNREGNGARILWNEPRVYSGKDSVIPKAGMGVGGTSEHCEKLPRQLRRTPNDIEFVAKPRRAPAGLKDFSL